MAFEMSVSARFSLAFLQRFPNNPHYQPAAGRSAAIDSAIPFQSIFVRRKDNYDQFFRIPIIAGFPVASYEFYAGIRPG